MEIEPLIDDIEGVSDIDAVWALPDNQNLDAVPPPAVSSMLEERRPSLVPSLSSDYASSNVSGAASAGNMPTTPETPTFASNTSSHYSPNTTGVVASKSASSIP